MKRLCAFLVALVFVFSAVAALVFEIRASSPSDYLNPGEEGEYGRNNSVDIRYVYEFLKAKDEASYGEDLRYYKRVDYIPTVNTAPTLDGNIDSQNYSVTNPVKTHSYKTNSEKLSSNLSQENNKLLNEYFAQDENNIYMAFELPKYSADIPIVLEVRSDDDFATGGKKNVSAMKEAYAVAISTEYDGEKATTTIGKNNSSVSTSSFKLSEWKQSAEDTAAFKAPTTSGGAAYIEYSIPKTELMKVMKLESMTQFSYVLRYSSTDDGEQHINYISNAVNKNAAVIKSIHTSNVGATKDFDVNYAYYQTFRNVGLLDLSEVEDFDVREDLVKYGYKNYTVKGFASPQMDGVIAANEYTLAEKTSASDTKNNGLEYDVTEYFAHDEEYVYYGLSVPANGETSSIYLFFLMKDSTRVGENYHNAIKLQCSAKDDIEYSESSVIGDVNIEPEYSVHKYSLKNEDFEFVGLVKGTTVTYEIKIDRSKMAMAAGTEEITDYAFYLTIAGKYYAYDLSATGDLDVKLKDVEHYLDSDKIAKNVKLSAPDIQTYDSASIRIDTAEKSGIRFKTMVSKDYIKSLEDKGYTDIDVGTLIAPADYVDDKLTHEMGTLGEHFVDVDASISDPFEENDKYVIFTGSLVNINEWNINREFTAVGYISYKENGVTKYIYANEVTKKISNVADIALASGEYDEDADALEILNYLAGKSVAK